MILFGVAELTIRFSLTESLYKLATCRLGEYLKQTISSSTDGLVLVGTRGGAVRNFYSLGSWMLGIVYLLSDSDVFVISMYCSYAVCVNIIYIYMRDF